MAKGNKKTAVVVVSLVVLGSIGAYLWFKHKKAVATEGGSSDSPSDAPVTPEKPSRTSKKTPSTFNPQLSGKADIMAFQDWMDAKHPNWVNGKNLNRRNGYGSFGPATSKAWKTYAAEYLKVSPAEPPAPKALFRSGQDVTAKINFRGSAIAKRNGRWFTTDASGNPLPTRQFLKTAYIGPVQFPFPNDPNRWIVLVKDGVGGYPYMIVKKDWIE